MQQVGQETTGVLSGTLYSPVRTYYGEYSLKHWLELLLSKNIVLPEYQRSFVWDLDDVKKLIFSLDRGAFVPSITIAHDQGRNIILDGQQRLTSLLLASLNLFPTREKFQASRQAVEVDAEESLGDTKEPLEWTFHKLIPQNSLGKMSLREVSANLQPDCYSTLFSPPSSFEVGANGVLPDFYSSHYIGFTYIIYDDTGARGNTNATQSVPGKDANRYFAELFRSLNYTGKSLSPEESRRALYFRNPEFTPFFEGKIDDDTLCSDLKVKIGGDLCRLDWIRYLAILTAAQISDCPLKYYSSISRREIFFEDYVSWVVGLEQESYPDKFSTTENPNRDLFVGDSPAWKDRYAVLKEAFRRVEQEIEEACFPSQIDADYWLFGLVNLVLFKGETLSPDSWNRVVPTLKGHISDAKNDEAHLKSINSLRYTYMRLRESIGSYTPNDNTHTE